MPAEQRDNTDKRDFTIGSVYPWGRTFDEYVAMFSLSPSDLEGRILGCGDGPAAFNAAMAARGRRVVSCDPLYAFSGEEIRRRIRKTSGLLIGQARHNAHRFVWNTIRSPKDLLAIRLGAMEAFLADFPAGRREGRYSAQALPRLDFPDQSFELALCSHFLFLYSDELPVEFHIAGIVEMCRVAREVRIFPLLDLKARPSVHLEPVMRELLEFGFAARRQRVEYEFLRGANEMLVIVDRL